MARWWGRLGADLGDLVLPGVCAGCGERRVPLRTGVCAACVAALEILTPAGHSPTPPPPGMPPCVAVGPYAGELRATLLAYKERGRHRLARPLGALLATAVSGAATRAGGGPGVPVLLIPVPSTPGAARERGGDHMARLAVHAARRLRRAGWAAEVHRPLRALPRPDSVSLDAHGRATAAENSLRIRQTRMGISRRRPTMRGTLIVVDDIVTTGATLAAVTGRLREANMQVTGAAVLAATRLRNTRRGPPSGGAGRRPQGPDVPLSGSPTRGDGQASAG